jgi:putative Mg2+ transporter-C (MgtC) family protein
VSIILDELSASLPTAAEAVRFVIRLLAALLAGGAIGWQREASHKSAGLRTHMLVCAGTTTFVLAAVGMDMQLDAMSRVVQGLITGIGFLGAGAILKLESSHQVKGLTTAAGIWMTAALGAMIGLGQLGLAVIGTALTWLVLSSLLKVDKRIDGPSDRTG